MVVMFAERKRLYLCWRKLSIFDKQEEKQNKHKGHQTEMV